MGAPKKKNTPEEIRQSLSEPDDEGYRAEIEEAHKKASWLFREVINRSVSGSSDDKKDKVPE